jgi:hypothetical protein
MVRDRGSDMNTRVSVSIAGTVILLLGLAGLLYPTRIMSLLGFTVLEPAQAAAALGEIRATYGGLFVVMGIYTMLTAINPPAHRGRMLFIALLWLGACAGRLVGVWLNGSPGLFGWVAVAFELGIGGALLVAALLVGPAAPPPQVVPVGSTPPVRSPEQPG